MFDMITPRGASELIIESPRHDDTLATHGARARSSRCCGCTATGSSISSATARSATSSSRATTRSPGWPHHHPYSRVTAIPIVFDETRRELREAREYYQYKRRCLYCDILRQEIGRRGAGRPAHAAFAALVPYAARVPLEMWIVPRQHGCSFEEALPGRDRRATWRGCSPSYFRALARSFGDPGYEMVLHTAPNLRSRILQGDWATIRDDYHWHIEITPEPEHANRVGGIFVNETRPETAAAELRHLERLEPIRGRARGPCSPPPRGGSPP